MAGFKDSMRGTMTMKAVAEEVLGEGVIAIASLSQGKPPSMVSMMTGTALIGLVRPRASKALPKRFLLAVTAERVVALKGTQVSDEDGNDTGAVVRDEIATWPRGEVSANLTPTSAGEDTKGGTLEIPGASIPVFARSLGDPSERELFEALAA